MKILGAFTVVVLISVAPAGAEEKEPFAVIELGSAAAWDLPGGRGLGPSAAIEFQAAKNISVEGGLSPLFNNQGRADWEFDVVVHRQFDLSETIEFEPGIGPTWSNSGQFGATGSLEFIVWPRKDRKLGWFVDPTYSVSFAAGHQQSLGLTVGLLIAIPGN
jgi:hypothetical protein